MRRIVGLFLVLGFIVCASAEAQAARIDILPRKIFIDDRQRSAEITILNLGQQQSHVRLTMISYRQKEDGTYEDLGETPLSPVFSPEKDVRVSPKQFTLPAGGRQKIRIAIQRPADLPDGEYRFHVKAISFDDEDFSVHRQPAKGNSVALKMNVAVVIPVVVRKGALTTAAKIENVSFLSAAQAAQGQPALAFDLVRKGTAGVMGTVRVMQAQAGESAPKQIGIVSNLNVFSEVAKRHVQVPLNEVPKEGTISLVYTNDYGDKGIIDEVVLQK